MKNKDFKSIEKLKEYFTNTPKEQIEKDWEEIERLNIGGPSIDDFFNTIEKYNKLQAKIIGLNRETNKKIDEVIEELFLIIFKYFKSEESNREKVVENVRDIINKLLSQIFNQQEWLKLQHYYDSTIGMDVTDINPRDLLRKFWEERSSICPLPMDKRELQEKEFEKWIEKYIYMLE